MDPPFRERYRWRSTTTAGAGTPGMRGRMASAGSLFLAAGALFALISVLTPDSATNDEELLLALAAVAAAMAAGLILVYDRLPIWAFHAGTVAGAALAGAAVYAWGSGSAYGPLPFLWVVLFAFYFFPLGAALVHMAAVAASYAIALAAESPAGTQVDGWIATVGTLLAAGLLVAALRHLLAGTIASLTEASHRDPLTGLLNRRGFEDTFDLELERARRSNAPLSLIVGDLDLFKRINDTYGHPAGDAALERIAHTIQSAKRGFDSGARVGGEEFALLAPESDENGAYMLAERIRTEVDKTFAGANGHLTISFGIATFPLHGQTADSLLRAADQALYAAKRLGRNRTVISSAEVPGILARPPHGREEAHVELTALLSLAEALDVRDSGSATHCHRVGRLAELMARELGLAPDSVERVRLAGILHDVGRVGMPDSLVRKDGPLTDQEWSWVRSHPEIGARLVETTEFDDIRSWILFHHERPDGRGYPEGRTATEVPLEARILAVADAYEAMTSERPYRAALAPEEAAEELRSGAGRQFDEDVVEALLRAV
jgi:diguanylate cyclase (GGDEF)-like protein/putative nucleotidyltransferase with HDIG domain